MDVLFPRCCGIDVHKKMVMASVSIITPDGHRHKETRRFETMTRDLLALSDWLAAHGCTHVAMESTGVYWKPIYNLLAGQFEVMIVNAQHIKAVPGRKTDVRDAEWIADLLQHGLLRASFIPDGLQRELRELTRYRVSLREEHTRMVNRLHKTLEDTNIKLGSVVKDLNGVSAREMLQALLAGQRDPAVLAAMARGRLKAKRAELEAALVGVIQPHHHFLLTELLLMIDTLDEAIERVTGQIEQRLLPLTPSTPPSPSEPAAPQDLPPAPPPSPALSPQGHMPPSPGTALEQAPPTVQEDPLSWEGAITLLCSIPGIAREAAQGILAEIGLDMSRFPSAKHLASWAGICPGNHESAGKRKSGKIRKGNVCLRRLLIQAAHAASHTKHTYLSALFHRFRGRLGATKAAVAVGHAILGICYHVLGRRVMYQDLGENFFDERDRQAAQKRLVHRLENLGFEVSLQPKAPMA